MRVNQHLILKPPLECEGQGEPFPLWNHLGFGDGTGEAGGEVVDDDGGCGVQIVVDGEGMVEGPCHGGGKVATDVDDDGELGGADDGGGMGSEGTGGGVRKSIDCFLHVFVLLVALLVTTALVVVGEDGLLSPVGSLPTGLHCGVSVHDWRVGDSVRCRLLGAMEQWRYGLHIITPLSRHILDAARCLTVQGEIGGGLAVLHGCVSGCGAGKNGFNGGHGIYSLKGRKFYCNGTWYNPLTASLAVRSIPSQNSRVIAASFLIGYS